MPSPYIVTAEMLGMGSTQLVDMVNNVLFPTLYRQGAANILLYRISPVGIDRSSWPGAVGDGPVPINFINNRTLTSTKQPYWLTSMLDRNSDESTTFMQFLANGTPVNQAS